jgi:TfoX/Sxy family transcriptional regulator of competence genes
MPYDQRLDARIRETTAAWGHTTQKKMFGGVCHLSRGNMFCGVHQDRLILRLGDEAAQEALRSPEVRPFDITGRPMKGWVMVESAAVASEEALRDWLRKAWAFAKTLPSK